MCKETSKGFRPQVAPGSICAIEVKVVSNGKILINQDNGMSIVLHPDNIEDLIHELRKAQGDV